MSSQLESLRALTTVVADSGDIESIEHYRPTDATTNPSLIFKAAQMPQYRSLLEEAASYAQKHTANPSDRLTLLLDKLTVNFGAKILSIVPGRVSTEVDARLSFDAQASIERAKRLVALYDEAGIDRKRILIKLATTWEGVEAARQLEKEGIHCNMTLLFCPIQAVAAAEAGATLISPFVGRILDWYKKAEGVDSYAPEEDPGVRSVTEIYNYYKKFDYKTQVMGASFRNKDEILQLAGCDLLTISPELLNDLESSDGSVTRKLDPATALETSLQKLQAGEPQFRWHLNENPMATEKLAEGIRNFAADTRKLETFVRDTVGTALV